MRCKILTIEVDQYTLQETVTLIASAVVDKRYLQVVTANPELIYRAGREEELSALINRAGLVTPDGIGVVWAARLLGTPVPERVTGIDLMEAIFPVAGREQWRVFFLGGHPGVAEQAKAAIATRHPGIIIGTAHGYFTTDEENGTVNAIRHFRPDLLCVGLGAPRQEYWNAAHPRLATVSIGVGGSFDALAGIVPRAPQWAQALRLEWLYRLVREPWRWRRQSVLPRFVYQVLRQKFQR